MPCLNFFEQVNLYRISCTKLELDKYSKNSSKGRVFKDGLEYHKKLNDLKSNYPLASDRIEKKNCLIIN